MNRVLGIALWWAATGQAAVALLNLNLTRILGWKTEVSRMSLLVREVFQIHTWFISLTLMIFAILTWRFGPLMISGEELTARWLAVSIGIFWGLRAILQITHYSGSHWRGDGTRTIVHFTLLFVYSAWAFLYFGVGTGIL